jgi:hypothetical protein
VSPRETEGGGFEDGGKDSRRVGEGPLLQTFD